MGSGEPDTDAQLVARAQRGDQRAFELLVMKYQRRIERLIGRMVRLIAVYSPWLVETYKAQNILMQPWLVGYKKHPFSHEPWKYVDIDLDTRARAK